MTRYKHIQKLIDENVEEVILHMLRISMTTPSVVNGVYQTFYVGSL